jgi:tetratricopeptide (TPR) repeat protein
MKMSYLLIPFYFLLSINLVQAQNNSWCAVMMEGDFAQTYDHSKDFPSKFIESKWRENQYVSDLTYANGEWYVVTSALGYTQQAYYKDKQFPGDWIEQKWKEDFDITKVVFGGDFWVVVMSKGAGLTSESWGKRSTFDEIKEFIRGKWNDGKDIISLAYGNGEWVAVLAKGADYDNQTYNWGTEFPTSWVNEKYKEGRHITSLAYGDGVWLVAMSEHSQSYKERYMVSADYPSSFIDYQWNDGKRIKALHFNYEKDLKSSFDEYFNLGIAAANEEKHDLAIYYYTEALKIDPNNSTAYNNLAWSKYLNGQCPGALADADKSIQLDPTEYNYHTRASIYICLGRCREALTDLNKTIEIAAQKEGYYYADRAKARVCLGNEEDAIEDYDKAIALDPTNASKYRAEKDKLEKKNKENEKPTITWDYPHNDFVSSTQPTYNVKACIHSEAKIKSLKLYLNGQTFVSRGLGVDSDCTENINEQVKLVNGKNELEIVVETDNTTVRSEKRTIEYKSAGGSGSGNYHALLIGVENYDDFSMNDLEKPIDDCEALQKTLTEKYTFQPGDVHVLKNPKKEQILEKLIYLQERLTSKDNLLIFYSGHGVVKNEIGYWLPSDSEKDSRMKWFSNSELRDYVNGIKTMHTLVIADACFSGSIFTGGYRDITEFACDEMEKIPSRRAMTSGANTVVPDNSIFFQYLVKKLDENDESCLSAETLYTKVKPAVIYNSPNNHIPQFGVMPQAGDEGGNFIFRKR